MKYYSSFELRNMFLEYFRQKNHLIEEGAPLVPNNDPSLLWINSGVSALKKYFDGSITLEIPRIANSQRSIRTNDIENVGLTARHHTMFEMLGNFSIGDYFKKEAVEFAWEFLTSPDWIGFDVDKLYVTIYIDDEEAYDIWRNVIGLDDSRIFRLEGNFWEIGAGPCGPNSEIFYDRGIEYDPNNIGIDLLAKDLENDRYIEIWNIVFSQYNAEEDKPRSEYKLLPQKNIDTGMGLERLTAIVQGAETNFDTDLFMPIIEKTTTLSKFPYEGEYKKAYKVIADHIRALTFAIADGAIISSEGRGYVLKRLLRRASRFGLELGINEPFLYKLVEVVAKNMSNYYPYLLNHVDLVANIIKSDEERFLKTLDSGMKLFNVIKSESKNNIISGADAFKLYDTYGFPIEIVQELSLETDFKVDMDGFNQLMEKQKQMARESFKEGSNFESQSADLLNFKEKFEFVGYTKNEIQATITGLFKDGKKVTTLIGIGEIAFNQSVFYAESGGQISDKGTIEIDNKLIDVLNVRKAPNGQHLHLVEVDQLDSNSIAMLKIDLQLRKYVMRNHSATHLLHKSLREVLGTHVSQAGSYVSDEYLRFDFNHYQKLSKAELDEIEEIVNEQIFKGLHVDISHMDLKEAKALGAQALFSDKYEDEVRVIKMDDFSLELCGGTHVNNTIEIGLFKIEKEESVSSGIRRIIACTSKYAYQLLKNTETKLNTIQENLSLKDQNIIVDKVIQINKELNILKKENASLNEQLFLDKNDNNLKPEKVNNINLYIIEVEIDDIKEMKTLVDKVKNENVSSLVVVYTKNNKKPYIIGVANDLVINGISAKSLAQLINLEFEGKGGGKDDMVQGASQLDLDRDKVILLVNKL